MESMDNFRERFEALERQTEQLKHQTHTLARQARWWRGIACGVIILALLGIPLQSGKAQYEGKDLAQRVADLEYKLEYVSGGPNEVVITGANLRIVNGLGGTDCTDDQGRQIPNCPNGLGNLIVGYNESRTDPAFPPDTRTGSHNIVVGRQLNFSSFGGLVVGDLHEISGAFASVSGGFRNTASGNLSSVSGGADNIASAFVSSVSGGVFNTASGVTAAISGGQHNTARGVGSSVSGGGENNTASGDLSSVSGGTGNTASGFQASVSGGFGNTASGTFASVSGGEHNTASGRFSSVSGGTNRTAPGEEDWAAGPLFADN